MPSFLILLPINIVAKTNKADMFTVTTASKKKSCESKEWSIFGVVDVDA